jgi:predicted ester cyclase
VTRPRSVCSRRTTTRRPCGYLLSLQKEAAPDIIHRNSNTREARTLARYPDLHMTIEAIVVEADTVAVRILSEGTNLGPLNEVVPPTGKRFAARQSHWFRIQDGKLADHWATREDLVAMLQLGVVQPPGQSSS